jgi:hypothetical protein
VSGSNSRAILGMRYSHAAQHHRAEVRCLALIVGCALVARIPFALLHGDTVVEFPGIADQVSYHTLALRVLAGHGFSFETGWWPATQAGAPTAHWSYLYVGWLSSVYWLFGEHPLIPRLIQAVVTGILQPLLTWRIARHLFGPRAGLVAAGIAASYVYFAYYAGALVTEAIYLVAILWMVDAALRIATPHVGEERTVRAWVNLGLACATAVLLRQVLLLLVPVVVGWVVWRVMARRRREGASMRATVVPVLGSAAVALAVVAACVLPWTVRNYRAFDRFVLLNTNAGFAFFWGNHPTHGTEFIPILPGLGSAYAALIPDDLRGLNEAELDRALLGRGLGFVWADLPRFAKLSVSRAREYFKFWPSSDSSTFSNIARVLSFGIWLPFMVFGMALALMGTAPNGDGDRSGVGFLLLLCGLYALVHLLTWTLVRYRLPIDALLMPFAALAVVWAYDRLTGGLRARRARRGALIGVVISHEHQQSVTQ